MSEVAKRQRFGGLIESEDISYLRKAAKGRLDFPPKRIMLLEPDTKKQHKVPILKVSHETARGHEVIRYQVCLFVMDQQEDDAASSLCSIGLRFETPEGVNSIHGYYHAQFCRYFHGHEEEPFPKCPSWLPCQHPAIPVLADGPFSLMVAMFKSLYGAEFGRRLSSNGHLVNRIKISELLKTDRSLAKLLGTE